jgi:cholesterol oxidase
MTMPGAEVDRMEIPVGRGLAFRETMSGWFALDATDPAAGARDGRARRTALRMRANIRIPNLAAFVNDRGHLGTISGSIDFPPLGRDLVAPQGEFRLFAPPAGGDAGKRMVYVLEFTHQGEPHRLAGEKVVNGGRPLLMWPETTTLYTRLERGSGARKKVVGAGVLHISVGGMLSMLFTLRATGPTAAARFAALVRFGGFFGAELWDSYVAPRRALPSAPRT